MDKKLAIVIPAYKDTFLDETLNSIANQSCQNFTLYIGDDGSPYNINEIVKKYEQKITIVYTRFDENKGGKDLVAHWHRCISLTHEEWIWLFSDDDIMDKNCVEQFYNYLNQNEDAELLHFDIQRIDKDGQIIGKSKPFPQHLSVSDFFSKRIRYEIYSVVVEYIFKRKKYDEESGFENFDLAWCADDSGWIKFGRNTGIVTIAGANVKWRYSGLNISSSVNDKQVVLRKVASTISYIKWIKAYFENHGLADQTSDFDKIKWVMAVLLETSAFSLQEKSKLIKKVIRDLHFFKVKHLSVVYLFYWEIKKNLLQIARPG